MTKDYVAPMGEGIYEVNTGDWRTRHPQMNKDRCIECGICSLYCPVNAIKGKKNGNAKMVFAIDLSYCKGCGVCSHECPHDAIDMIRETKR